jgi:hypothetical protein
MGPLQRRPATRLDELPVADSAPDTDQLKNYRFFVENLTKLPGW